MRLGFTIGTWGPSALGPAEQAELAQEAERLGYDSVWASEAYGADPGAVLTWLAAHTTRLGLGAGVLQATARGPVTAALLAATVDNLSGGRFRLGFGASGPQVVEAWHGRPYTRPLETVRETVGIVRAALAGEPVRHGPGEPLKPTIRPVQERLPVYVAAMGPRAIALAGEIADGWLPMHCPPSYLAEGKALLGPVAPGFDVAPMLLTYVDEDVEYARDVLRPMLAIYLGGMGSREANFYNRLAVRLGFADAATRVQELYLSGRRGEAMDALPDALIDEMTLCGPPSRVAARLSEYAEAGATTIITGHAASSLPERVDQLRLLAELAA
ncbi:LLM class flavin-dependent oxidoreductase [Bailinhaonella thermotolerans]|uniref:LLM class flavin-dependent oxidoreductase n=1 Tax=Bailinhaonella thermotolerans TaxID=1070861 RepID=A0A3A4B129_9ACTN|nr:LLM class flavin-dependent oxidoreductase [Bailinhaonella thermotolerans]